MQSCEWRDPEYRDLWESVSRMASAFRFEVSVPDKATKQELGAALAAMTKAHYILSPLTGPQERVS